MPIKVGRSSRILDPSPAPKEAELEILVLLSYGENYEDLAFKYGSTRHAIQVRVHRMRELFGVENNAELVATALRRNWIQ